MTSDCYSLDAVQGSWDRFRIIPNILRRWDGQKPKRPKVFLKPNTSVIGHGDAIEIPPDTTRVDHEAELAIVIGKHLYRSSESDVWDGILGVTIVNDVTARDFQRRDGVLLGGKGSIHFCPMGPWILLDGRREELQKSRRIQCWVDGEVKQDSSTSDLLFGFSTLVSFVSNVMTLLPGDVIATGTPSGVSPLSDGQEVQIEVEGIGVLRNPVVNREDRCQVS